MMSTFEFLHRQLAKATVTVLFAALTFLGLTLLCALLGHSNAVLSFRSVAAALGYVFGGMLATFLLTTLIGAVARFLHRRSNPVA